MTDKADKIRAIGQEYDFCFSFNIGCEIEAASDHRTLFDVLRSINDGGMIETRLFFRHCLRDSTGARPSDDEAGRILDEVGMKAASERIIAAIAGPYNLQKKKRG